MSNQIIEILEANDGIVIFNESLTVKMSPHTPPEKIVSVFLNRGNIYVTLKDGKIKYANTDNIVNSLIQRLRLMQRIQKTIK